MAAIGTHGPANTAANKSWRVLCPDRDYGFFAACRAATSCSAAAVTGNHLTANYTGYLSNGTAFDTSIGRAPFGFKLGQSQVIAGWEQGFVGMRVGGRRQLIAYFGEVDHLVRAKAISQFG